MKNTLALELEKFNISLPEISKIINLVLASGELELGTSLLNLQAHIAKDSDQPNLLNSISESDPLAQFVNAFMSERKSK